EPGSAPALRKFLKEGEYKYNIGIRELVYKPGVSLSELMDLRLVKGMLKLHVLQSVTSYVKKFFHNKRLVQLLEFPVLFLGATPEDTPAVYTVMNYADMRRGTCYPKGGMHQVIKAMVELATSLGVTFRFNSAVERIELNSVQAKGLLINGKSESFDF